MICHICEKGRISLTGSERTQICCSTEGCQMNDPEFYNDWNNQGDCLLFNLDCNRSEEVALSLSSAKLNEEIDRLEQKLSSYKIRVSVLEGILQKTINNFLNLLRNFPIFLGKKRKVDELYKEFYNQVDSYYKSFYPGYKK